LPTCEYKYESDYPEEIKFACSEPSITNSKFCIFHDKDHYTEHEQEAVRRFKEKVSESISENKPLKCIGYYLPEIHFAKLLKEKTFAQSVYFNKATFYEGANFREVTFEREADFTTATFAERATFSEATFSKKASFFGTTFSEEAEFSNATFSREASFRKATFSGRAVFLHATFSREASFRKATFSEGAVFEDATFSERVFFSNAVFSGGVGVDFHGAKFLGEAFFLRSHFDEETLFRYTLFEQPNKVTFEDSNLSKVSFADSDITRIRFGDKIRWGGKDEFTIIEEEWLKEKAKEKDKMANVYDNVSLELVLSVYRNLRENYEFRLRYDDAGKFFIKEMELKRKYRQIEPGNGLEIKENGWFRRHFSLTGLYYHLSRYGESISRPAIVGAITVVLSTLFWVTQSNPTLEPHFPPTLETNSTSTFVEFREIGNPTQWLKGFERSLAGFLPFLSAGGETKVGIIDYIIKIFGGGLTFVLLAIALRRKFERKYTR
jgi:uncharacterized protein YjbI with pentapeptide repeats